MDDFLSELKDLLNKHKATILRSANSSNDLVISILTGHSTSEEIIFAEEISPTYIQHEWYSR